MGSEEPPSPGAVGPDLGVGRRVADLFIFRVGKVKGAFTALWTAGGRPGKLLHRPPGSPQTRLDGRPKAWRAWMAWKSLWKVRGDVGGRVGGKKKRVDDEIRTRAC